MKYSPKQLSLLLLLAICCSACISTMKVKVDIIDRKKLMTAPEVLLMEVLAMSETEQARLSNRFYQSQRDEIVAAFETVLDTMEEKANMPLETRAYLSRDLKLEIDSVYQKLFIPKLNSAITASKSFFHEKPSKEGSLTERQLDSLYVAKSKFTDAKQLLDDHILKWSTLKKEWIAMIRASSNLEADFYKDIIDPALHSALQANNNRQFLEILHKGLYDDPLNSFITQAPRQYWRKMYNKTVAKNLLGDTDIAVVMETPGNFFIKGVRMDAENVTKHLANTFNTSVRFLGKVSGLDMGTRTPKAAESTPTTKSALLAEQAAARKAAQELEIHEKITRLSIINIMDAIIAQKDSLSSDSGYQEALTQIKDIYSVHKSQLDTVTKQ